MSAKSLVKSVRLTKSVRRGCAIYSTYRGWSGVKHPLLVDLAWYLAAPLPVRAAAVPPILLPPLWDRA